MKIFKIDETEWWIGESFESVREAVQSQHGLDDDHLEDMREVTEEEMGIAYFDVDTACSRTYAEQLQIEVEAGGEFPRLFATTEY